MRLILISDIHGNYPALKSIYNSIKQKGYDLIINLGDVLGIGPFAIECIDLLQDFSNIINIQGNYDSFYLKKQKSTDLSYVDLFTIDSIKENRKYKRIVQSWNQEKTIIQNKQSFYFTHYANNNGNFKDYVKYPNFKDLQDLYSDRKEDVICFGHTHNLIDLSYKNKRYINPGSVGINYHEITRYTIISIEKENMSIQHNSLSYDHLAYKKKLSQIQKLYNSKIRKTL